MDKVLERVKIRLADDQVKDAVLEDLVTTAQDRICLRVGAPEFPEALASIAVDVAVKLYRRQYYEGISSESAAELNTSFVEDVLAEYDDELASYRRRLDEEKELAASKKVVRFL